MVVPREQHVDETAAHQIAEVRCGPRVHDDGADDLKVDTHGAAVKQEVWQLLAEAYRLHGVRPTLLELRTAPLVTALNSTSGLAS